MDNGPHGFSDPDADETFDRSEESEETSSTSSNSDVSQDETKAMFDGTKPLVLELHDLKRTAKEHVGNVPMKPKKKIRRKRKSKDRSKKTKQTSSSGSGTSLTLNKEPKFYDAHESYHGITGPPNTIIATPPIGVPPVTAEPPKATTAAAHVVPEAAKTTLVTKPATRT